MTKSFLILIGAGLLVAILFFSKPNTAKDVNNDSKNNSVINTTSTALANDAVKKDGKIIYLDTESFKSQIFDFSTSETWKYKGDKPAIIDFYADWCRPCRLLAPVLVELQNDYGSDIQIYKIDTDKNPELSQAFGIRGIPALLFIPQDGEPQMATGLLPKESLENYISEILKVSKK